MTGNTDAKLAAAALQGDADSYNRLCGRYYPARVAIAYAQLCDRDLAEDAAQGALPAVVSPRDKTNKEICGDRRFGS